MTGRKKPKFPLRNVGGSVQKTASTLFSSDWDGKPHGVGYLAAGADMDQDKNQVAKMTTTGFSKLCWRCNQMIWMQKCWDQSWKPFDFPDETRTGNWDLHTCKIE